MTLIVEGRARTWVTSDFIYEFMPAFELRTVLHFTIGKAGAHIRGPIFVSVV